MRRSPCEDFGETASPGNVPEGQSPTSVSSYEDWLISTVPRLHPPDEGDTVMLGVLVEHLVEPGYTFVPINPT